MYKKTILALAIGLTAAAAQAADYYVVTPVKGKTVSNSAISVALANSSLPDGKVGIAYGYDFKQNLQVTGDTGYTGFGVSWAVSSGTLPAGLTLDSKTGVLSGTPSASGTASFSVGATYKTKNGTSTYQVVVTNLTVALAAGSPPQASVGTAYSYNLNPLLAVGGDSSFNGSGVTWAVVSNTLPAGLYLNASGYITGTPTTAGTGTITARATYKSNSGEQTYQVVAINVVTASLAAATPPQALVGTPYSFNLSSLLTVSGDAGFNGSGVTWSIVSSSLPAGLYLTSDGFIGGTPTAAGTGSLTARATYTTATGDQTYQVVSLNINVALATTTLTNATVGTSYNYDFKSLLSVTGDSGYASSSVTWAVVGGSLPAGLALNSATGVVTGTPTTAGSSNFTLRATYRTKTGSQSYDLTVIQLVAATGGTVTYNGEYAIHTFTSNGTFQLSTPSSVLANILVVGGGGGGGYDGGGGGGAGAVSYQTNYTLNAGSYNVVVGAGGAATTASGANTGALAAGKQGASSSFGSITAIGGGAAGGKAGTGAVGASGGGNGHTGSATGGAGTAGLGYAGGGASSTTGGGGGGVGGAGVAGATVAGHGGLGTTITVPGLAATTYACGGGGGTYTTSSVGLACGGTVSASGTGGNLTIAPKAGAANTGSGGGGGGAANNGLAQGAAGGSGVVIITYKKQI